MAEFKKLSDVEVVAEPAESANVLIEENGVIKRAPKTAVGGAGGGDSTIVVKLDNSNSTYGMPAPEGMYQKLQDMFNHVAYYNIVILDFNSSDNRFNNYGFGSLFKNGDKFEGWYTNGANHLVVHPDNTLDFFYDD